MTPVEHAIAAIEAVTSAMLPRRPSARDYLLADVRDRCITHDDSIASMAILADIEDGTHRFPDGTETVRCFLTDSTQDRFTELELFQRLAAAITGGPQKQAEFGIWFCGWFAADCADVVRRFARGEIEP